MPRTERLDDEEGRADEAETPRTWLVRVGFAGAPVEPPAAFDLAGVSPASPFVIGRDHQPDTRDPWMSSAHAEIAVRGSGWILRDLGSSNGTLFWGERRSEVELSDGDLFETGGTFWIFRSAAIAGGVPALGRPGVLASLNPGFLVQTDRARRVAPARVPVMLLGATGTGKEVIAREIHALSDRSGPFVAINTAAIQKTLVASELFGVEKGAHSTAEHARPGQVRAADGGTLLLDEIGDMPVEVQAALLRMLQESEVLPVGGDVAVKVDVRVISATHQDLMEMVESGAFRADLYARLNGCTIQVPDLADRAEDLGLLIGRFVERYGGGVESFSPAAYRALLIYPWPHNVRELERAIEAATALSHGGRIELRHLPERVREHRVARERAEGGDDIEERYEREIRRLLELHRGNVTAVARSMGRSRMQIHRWLKRLKLSPDGFRP